MNDSKSVFMFSVCLCTYIFCSSLIRLMKTNGDNLQNRGFYLIAGLRSFLRSTWHPSFDFLPFSFYLNWHFDSNNMWTLCAWCWCVCLQWLHIAHTRSVLLLKQVMKGTAEMTEVKSTRPNVITSHHMHHALCTVHSARRTQSAAKNFTLTKKNIIMVDLIIFMPVNIASSQNVWHRDFQCDWVSLFLPGYPLLHSFIERKKNAAYNNSILVVTAWENKTRGTLSTNIIASISSYINHKCLFTHICLTLLYVRQVSLLS